MKLSTHQFPYKTSLSLLPIINYWRSKARADNPLVATIVKQTEELLEKAPELLEPITDEAVMERYKDIVELLMSAVIAPVTYEASMVGAVAPFGNYSFFHTAAFAANMLNSRHHVQYPPGIDLQSIMAKKVFSACAMILNKFYGVEVAFDPPAIMKTVDAQTGLDKYYKIAVDCQFVEVKNIGPLKPISKEEIQYLLSNYQNMDLWLEYLPADAFELCGFIVISLTDITGQEVLSALKYSLLEKESLVDNYKFSQIQQKIRSLFKLPQLQLGIGAFEKRRNKVVKYQQKTSRNFIYRDMKGINCLQAENEFYERFLEKGKPLIVEDLASTSILNEMQEQFKAQGIRNIAFIPLFYEKEIIGILELSSPNLSDLNSLSLAKIEDLLPLFSLAVKKSFEEQEAKTEAIIKEKFTAIHPSVEWRFTEAAMNLLEKQERGETAEIEPIVFQEVYPLYGASDIRNSSVERNKAIQQDLIAQLLLVKNLLEAVLAINPLYIYEKLNLAVSKHLEMIRSGLLSDAEIMVHDFLKKEIEPVIRHLADAHPVLQADIERYWEALDPELGIVYGKRKDFEESLMQINETLSAYIEEEEKKAQQMFPHYFEKYKTDGIEYNVYVGASLVEDKTFHPIYLKNLRLWQFISMCEIARRTKALMPQMKIPLETTQLILVQSLPLSIRFRMDERHFDVDGAYNIRYEIVKKRIDKAVIKGTKERLTQPGKIAIIYSQVSEALEYNDYIEYLLEKNLLTSKIERVELEDLQGVQGLKAIRVEVNLKEADRIEIPASKQIMEMVQAYSAG